MLRLWYNKITCRIAPAQGKARNLFSQLGPLFKTQLRQAESADTRLEIRRDEKQDQGRRQDAEKETGEADTLWTDTTTVSVDSLRAFLIGFLQNRGDATPDEQADMAIINVPAPETLIPANTMAARAVKAYTAINVLPPAPQPQATENKTENVDLVSLLKADEVRTMHQLIRELELLAHKGVQTLTIEKADTFLESLVLAVNYEKSKI